MPTKAKQEFNARRLMERAVEVMQGSIQERRNDGKASPLVGAVLYKSDGSVDTAYRGELRDGDHAEFALLERKNRAHRLDDAKLFTTLEPCAPGSRRHPKLPCAERIVLARIKEVWVGIEDPDPTVDRKGIKYLQEHGVAVKMFDRDLQEQIQAANKTFIAQAMERAAAAEEEKAKPVVLSPLEGSVEADFRDFSREGLERYRSIAKIPDAIASPGFQRRLLHQGLLQDINGRLVASGFGLLLFGKSPRDVMPQAGLLATIHYPNGKDEPRDFDEPLVLIPTELEDWLLHRLPSTIERSRMQRQRTPDVPFELVREAVVNALVHRDYNITGAKCQLIITPDTFVIKSPGAPVEPITLEQLQSFTAPMLSRNPVLHYVFARMEMAEERGMGLRSFKARATELALPLPKYEWEAPYLTLTLYRNAESAVRELGARAGRDEKLVWQFLASRDAITSSEIQREFGFDERKAQRVLKKLIDRDLLRRVGKGPSTRYEVVR